jgi:carboxysome shell carbonic anhydrase
MRRVNQQRKSAFSRQSSLKTDFYKSLYNNSSSNLDDSSVSQTVANTSSHVLTNKEQNETLRNYEVTTKNSFDEVKELLSQEFDNKSFSNLCTISDKLGINNNFSSNNDNNFEDIKLAFARKLYAKTIFDRFLQMSNDFFIKDPLSGSGNKQDATNAKSIFKDAGFHAIGLTPCADGRLAHIGSFVLRLPYSFVRRKAHAGSLFDVSESVRNWVFIEHDRFRKSIPSMIVENTKYLKIAVYHYSSSAPDSQGCAAHGSDDTKAANAALNKLKDFKKAIESRFNSGTTVQTLLIGLDTDNDSLRIHVPNATSNTCLKRFVDTKKLYDETLTLSEASAKDFISTAIDDANTTQGSTKPDVGIKKVIDYLITNNFSQIEYVRKFENGLYKDIGHAERFISIGSNFEEVQLRNLSYYSFLDTVEEGANDADIGIKIFKGLNIKNNLPIPVIIRCDYNSSVPGSKERATEKALRINSALISRYKGFARHSWLETLITIKDWTNDSKIEVINKTIKGEK